MRPGDVPAGLVGCACGVWLLTDRDKEIEIDGELHRYGRPCRVGEKPPLTRPARDLQRELERLRAAVQAVLLTRKAVEDGPGDLAECVQKHEEALVRLAAALRDPGGPTSAWEEAHEPIQTFPGQDPEAAGFPRVGER